MKKEEKPDLVTRFKFKKEDDLLLSSDEKPDEVETLSQEMFVPDAVEKLQYNPWLNWKHLTNWMPNN